MATAATSTRTTRRAAIPDTDVDRLRLAVLRLARRIRTSYEDEITPSQLSVMALLARQGALTVGQIADREHVRPPSASKIVGALEQAGLVERTVDPTDRRCQPITLTAAGRQTIDRARLAGRTFLIGQLDELTADEIDTLTAALPALERLLGSTE